MMIKGWMYYNHAAIPTCAPHETPDTSVVQNGLIWHNLKGGSPLLARWTTNWDCGYQTNWWYVIKDKPFDINTLKSKRRYEINKGKKNFKVELIKPDERVNEIHRVTTEAYSEWPKKYRPKSSLEQTEEMINHLNNDYFFGAFSKEESVLQGYAIVEDRKSYLAFLVLRTNPNAEKLGVNAAIIDAILLFFNNRISNGFYICDGSRSIRHETAFQDYLEKYFGFRKAYCRLNIVYKPWRGVIVKFLYPFRKVIRGRTRMGSNLASVLKMEEINRQEN